MKILIIHAHPEPLSFSSAMCSTAEQYFQKQGHEVKISDLYAMNFNPVASRNDFVNRKNPDYLVYALEQRYAYENDSLPSDIKEELEKLIWCDLLILNFPIYWFSTPAILKGWIDRVFISGIVYGGKRFYDHGGLAGKKAMLAITIGGQEHMFGPDSIHGPLENMLNPLLRGTLAYSGLSVLPPFVGWHVPYISEDARKNILFSYEERLRNIDSLRPLTFPVLSDFDKNLLPIHKS